MKKVILSIVVTLAMLCNISALAFTFPEPDWGALYKEKTDMVTTNDFELFVEGSVISAPYYGAKFEPAGGTYIGAVAETSANLSPLGSYLTYIDDMNQTDLYYPANTMIENDNVLSMVGWTIHDINTVNYSTVRTTLDTLSKYGKPMFIRFANEMNCSQLGDNPDKYIEVFRTVANMVHEYPNFAVVWSPNDLGALDRPFEYFYPGDEYVDWVGVSCYMLKYFQGNRETAYKDTVYFMNGAYAWATNKLKPVMEFMASNGINKPVMISEGGVATSSSYGDEYESWAAPRLRNMLYNVVMKYPQVKMINYFNTYRSNEIEKFDISNYQYAVDIFKEASSCGAYIREANDTARFVFQPAYVGETLPAENGVVKLYTLAYFANQPDITVDYSVDGSWYHSSNQIPYTCNLNISSMADGMHTVKISSNGNEKEYVFYKAGQSIRFGAEPDASAVQNESTVTVTLNGKVLEFNQPPVVRDDRTLVPLRAIFEALGATVDWNDAEQKVTSVKNGISVTLQIGNKDMYVNNKLIKLDVAAQLVNDYTMVPVRAISEAFECNVGWDEDTQTVIITGQQ